MHSCQQRQLKVGLKVSVNPGSLMAAKIMLLILIMGRGIRRISLELEEYTGMCSPRLGFSKFAVTCR